MVTSMRIKYWVANGLQYRLDVLQELHSKPDASLQYFETLYAPLDFVYMDAECFAGFVHWVLNGGLGRSGSEFLQRHNAA